MNSTQIGMKSTQIGVKSAKIGIKAAQIGMKTALITDIERASIQDGPGIRTVVFLKGCPLRCHWCHNPECMGFEPQEMYDPEKCIHCGKCREGCYSGARVLCGKEMTVDEVMQEILLDKAYYKDGGGVTFSGGEPMAHPGFLSEILDLCREEGIHTGVETSLIYYEETVFRKLDLIMADLKIWDENIHKTYTGVSNAVIKENFRKLNQLGIPIIARTPVIPTVDQQIDRISVFLQSLENVIQYELLPYHPLGVSKQRAFGFEVTRYEIPTKEYMEEMTRYAFLRRAPATDAGNQTETHLTEKETKRLHGPG